MLNIYSMRKLFLTIPSIALLLSFTLCLESFKEDQLKYSRVRQAYKEKANVISNLLKKQNIDKIGLRLYLRVFKEEQELELWATNNSLDVYKQIKTYSICESSGELGPKRKQGDLQVPEGYYHINVFNPFSTFHLSLGVNYPNKSDRILGKKGNLGGDIYIHGSCVTIGCIPITNEQIKELYVICVEAKQAGQGNIPVTFFPAKLTQNKMNQLSEKYKLENDNLSLWGDLKKGFDLFNTNKKLPNIKFLENGKHSVTK